MKTSLILEELSWFNLVNGSGNLPTIDQVTFSYLDLEPSHHRSLSLSQSCLKVGRKKLYMKRAMESKEKPAQVAGGPEGGWPKRNKPCKVPSRKLRGTKGKPRGMN